MRAWIYNKALMGLTPKWYAEVLNRLPAGAGLLDVGIGTGGALLRNAALIQSKNLTVRGVDIDVDYVRHCATQIVAQGLQERISVSEQSVYDHVDGPYDGVYFGASFMLLPDPVKALQHVSTLLKPGGLIYLTQTFHDKPAPIMEHLKPMLHRFTTIHFGRVTYERDFRAVVETSGLVLKELFVMGRKGKTSYRIAIVSPNS
jgi:SAM-dependent methyltransferase